MAKLELPEDLYNRIVKLAEAAGQTKEEYLHKVLNAALDDRMKGLAWQAEHRRSESV